jgi:hypothetical protein
MDKKDSKKSIWNRIKSSWNSLPEIVRFIGTLLSIVIALKILFPAAVMEINHFSAGPEVIEPGEASILSWEVTGASNVNIEPDIGSVNSSGSLSVSPFQTTTYKLIASGKGEKKISSCTVTVKKNSPLITSFDASPNSIKAGESTVLNWHVAGVSDVTIEPDIGVAEPTGASSVSPAKTTTYKLTASNGDKKDIAYCTVTVEDYLTSPKDNLTSLLNNSTSPINNQWPSGNNITFPKENLTSQENVPTIGSFNANPDMIGKGESSNLIWSVSSATEVSIEPGIGTVGLTGSQRIFPNETTTYTLTATNKIGSTNATKVVFVQKPTTPASPVLLSTPKQISPANGTVFDNSTSGATLEWTAVSSAVNYTVEIDTYDSSSNSWLSESSGSTVIPGVITTSYSFNFPAKGPGRWRVWAVGQEGQESKKSDWWNFN